MNSTLRVPVVAVSSAVALLFWSAAHSALAAGRCDQPTVGGEARACAARQEGPASLRRFILRTETIYGFSYWDFQPAEAAILAAQRGGTSAEMRSTNKMAMALPNSVR
jgi:hypothetical protein